jgi:hypothetical protein
MPESSPTVRFARDDIDGTKILAVPEPGILMLTGLGLVGLFATSRRRRQ